MKKSLLVLILVVFSSNIYSQLIKGYGVEVGYVNSTLSYSNISGNDFINRKGGISLGLFIELLDKNGFSIVPELKYIQKGADFTGRFFNGPESNSTTRYLQHNFISIPINIKYKFPLGATTPYISLAPRYDIYLNSKWEDEPSSNIKGLGDVFGGTLSIGMITDLIPKINPYLEISYHMDFTDFNGNVDSEIGIKNNALEFCVGIIL